MRIHNCAVSLIVVLAVSARAQPPARETRPTFEFHSNVWINLHHLLYRLAQPPGPPPRSPLVPPSGALSADEQRVWEEAIAFYREHVIQHDLLFDGEMRTLKRALARAEYDSVFRDSTAMPELVRTLNRAAPIYRRHWWRAHNSMNELWIAAARPLVAALGPQLADQLASAFQTAWRPTPIRVDVSNYAGPRLVAYTTGTSDGHVVVSSTDPCDQGYAALATLYHEASHTIVDQGEGALGEGIIAAAKARRVSAPDDLWHALMFYTEDEFLRRDFADLGIGFEPGSGVCDVYRGPWILYRDAAALFWRPHLFRGVPLDSALENLVTALSTAGR